MKIAIAVLLILAAIIVGVRAALASFRLAEKHKSRLEEMERWKIAIQRDPSNAGAHAQLAEILVEDGQYSSAVHAYEAALSILPHGPFSAKWRHGLKRSQDLKEGADRARAKGQKVPGFDDWNVCECGAVVSAREKRCFRCGQMVKQDFASALTETNILRHAPVFAAYLLAGFLFLCFLTPTATAVLMMVMAIAAYIMFRRS